MKRIAYLTFCALALAAGAGSQNAASTEEETADEPQNILYGINADNYRTESAEIRSGETLGKILGSYGVSAAAIDRLDKAAADVFPLRNIRAGHKYVAFIHEDSLFTPHLEYLAYERSATDSVVFGFAED